MKFLTWAAISLLSEVTWSDVYWVSAPTGAALLVIIALDIHDDRKKRRQRRLTDSVPWQRHRP